MIAFFKSEGATNVSILWKRDIVMTTFYKMSAVALFVSNLGVSGFGEDSWNSTGLSIIRHVKEAFVSKALSGSLLSTVKLNGVTVAPAKSIESIQTAFTVEDANPTTPAPVFKDISKYIYYKNLLSTLLCQFLFLIKRSPKLSLEIWPNCVQRNIRKLFKYQRSFLIRLLKQETLGQCWTILSTLKKQTIK